MKNNLTEKTVQPDFVKGEDKYRALFEQATDGIVVTDFEGNILEVNAAMCTMVGFPAEELLRMNVGSFIDPDQLKERPMQLATVAAGEHGFTERKIVNRNGRVMEVEVNAKKFDGDKILIIAHDVSERVNKYNIVSRSEENIKAILENTDTSYILINRNLVILTFNQLSQQKSRLFLAKEFKEGNYFLDSIPEARREIVRQYLQKVLKGESQEYESEYKLKDGTPIYLIMKEMPIKSEDGEIIGICISSVDITERKKAELEKEKARYQLNERVKELTALYRVGHIFEQEDKPLAELLKEVVAVLPDGWQYPESTAARIIVGDLEFKTLNYIQTPYRQQATFNTVDNRPGLIEIVYLEKKKDEAEGPFLKEERKLINMLADILRINISRRYEATALKNSEANLQTIFKATDTAYTLVDKDFCVISFNQQAARFIKQEFKKKAVIGAFLLDLFPPERFEEIKALIPEIKKGNITAFESSYKQADGSVNWYYEKIFPVYDLKDNVLGFMLAINDITERKKFDEKIRSQLQLLKELSFITSHELRHEYAKLHSIVDILNSDGKVDDDGKILLTEGLNSFNKINSIIYKLSDKITFGQVIHFDNVKHSRNIVEKILLVDDDAITNVLNARIMERLFDKEKINAAGTVDDALAYLKKNDTKGNHLILLDLNMPEKTGWDFLQAYSSFKIQSPVIILSSSVDPNDKEQAKGFDMVKNFVSKPLRFESIEKIVKQEFI